VKEDFKLLHAVRDEFEDTGIKVKLEKLIEDLPSAQEQMPNIELHEIMEIWNNRFMPGLTKEEHKTIYLAVFQFFAGLRHSELTEVQDDNITIKMVSEIKFPVLNYISYKGKNAKTNSVPLNSICMEIIEYWRTHKFKGPQQVNKKTKEVMYFPKCLLPVIPSTKYNKALHKFLKETSDVRQRREKDQVSR
jgi:hypothetical protein